MKPIKEMNQEELAALVQEYLRAREIEVVLCGGNPSTFQDPDFPAPSISI